MSTPSRDRHGAESPDTTKKTRPADVDDADRQEVRIAVVMTGGVSLAIWMGGVALELSRLQRGKETSTYAKMRDMLQVDVVTDVISGTSAGGLNGAFLAASIAYGTDLDLLRGTWIKEGSMLSLLRRPTDKDLTALMYGDRVFLDRVNGALKSIRDDRDVSVPHPLELFMTASILRPYGAPRFDRFGGIFPESKNLGLFHFTRFDFGRPRAVDQLALAARTSAAHPGGFEASFVPMNDADAFDDQHPSMQGIADWEASRYCVDGGVLLNRPLRPAIEAIFRQPYDREVRRLVFFVAPDPGELQPDDQEQRTEDVPTLLETVGSVTNLPRLQSISEEITAIEQHNEQLRRLRRLARSLRATETLGTDAWAFYDTYRTARAQRTASSVTTWLGIDPGSNAANVKPRRAQEMREWIEQAFYDRIDDPPTQPREVLAGDWRLGTVILERWTIAVEDFLTRALSIVPPAIGGDGVSDVRRQLRILRGHLSALMKEARLLEAEEQAFWEQPELNLMDLLNAKDHEEAWARWFGLRMDAMDVKLGKGRHDDLRESLAIRIAVLMSAAAPLVLSAATAIGTTEVGDQAPAWLAGGSAYAPSMIERSTAKQLMAELQAMTSADQSFSPSEAAAFTRLESTPKGATGCKVDQAKTAAEAFDDVRALNDVEAEDDAALRLAADVDHWLYMLLAQDVALAPALALQPPIAQEIELVQVSAFSKNAINDPREAPTDKLTGIQLAHFGAFYKRSWRSNDWIWGRLDGAYQICRAILDPQRLRKLRYTPEQARDLIQELVLDGASGQMLEWLKSDDQIADRTLTELGFLSDPKAILPTILPNATKWLAKRLQLEIVMEELPHLASSVAMDLADGGAESDDALALLSSYLGYPIKDLSRERIAKRARKATEAGEIPLKLQIEPRAAVEMFRDHPISRETLKGEYGSDLFTQTASKAAAAAVGTASGENTGLPPLAALFGVFRGSTLAAHRLADATVHQSRTRIVAIVVVLTLCAAVLGLWVNGGDHVPVSATVLAAGILVAALVLVSVRGGQSGLRLIVFVFAIIFGVVTLAQAGDIWTYFSVVFLMGAVAAIAVLTFRTGRQRLRTMTRVLGFGIGAACLLIGTWFALLQSPTFDNGSGTTECGVPALHLHLRFWSGADDATTSVDPGDNLCAALEWQASTRIIAAVALAIGLVLVGASLFVKAKRSADTTVAGQPLG